MTGWSWYIVLIGWGYQKIGTVTADATSHIHFAICHVYVDEFGAGQPIPIARGSHTSHRVSESKFHPAELYFPTIVVSETL